MGKIGCLGDIAFVASSKMIETLDNAVWSGSARYATHQRHGTNALTEFTGIDPDVFKFDIILSEYLGVDVMTELTKIWKYERDGTALPLVIGDHAYGKYRWSIVSHEIKMDYYDGRGNLVGVKVSVNLQEYLRE